MGPRAGLDGRKISSPPGFDPGPSFPPSKLPYFLKIKSALSGTEHELGGQPYTTVTLSDPEVMSSGQTQNAMT